MIGNDVIDLALAFENKNWKSERFRSKLFSETEKHLILQNKKPQFMVWLLWSMKEAAYKAHQRRFNLKRRYNPRDFKCFLEKTSSFEAIGSVRIGEAGYITQSFFDLKKIHSLASASNMLKPEFRLFEASSEIMKSGFLSHFSKTKNWTNPKLQLQKNTEGIPYLYAGSEALQVPFSFSHHGKFSGYAFAHQPNLKLS